MTTQIKFRGFRTDGKGWVEGYYVYRPDCKHLIYWQPFPESTNNTYHEIHPSSLGMFTGFTDKNRKEIYGAIGERGGDITESAIFGKATIIWSETHCGFIAKWHTKGQTANIHHATKHAEIIGNQFERRNGK